MKRNYKPTIYVKDIYSINYKKLKDNHIKYLLFDLDNTICDNKTKVLPVKAYDLFNTLKKENFTIFIISNSWYFRVRRFTKKLKVQGYSFALKPFTNVYKKIIKKNNINIQEMAAIGDQIYTDIIGANKMNITSVLVDRISNKESILTKINRIRENQLIKKRAIIKRGVYDE